MNTKRPITTVETKTSRLATRPSPSCAITGAVSPNTPTGAVHRIQWISLTNTALMSSANEIRRARRSSARAPAAAATRTANTMRESREPSEAARKGLAGIRLRRKSRRPGTSDGASSRAPVLTVTGQIPSAIFMKAMPMAMAGIVVPQKNPRAEPQADGGCKVVQASSSSSTAVIRSWSGDQPKRSQSMRSALPKTTPSSSRRARWI